MKRLILLILSVVALVLPSGSQLTGEEPQVAHTLTHPGWVKTLAFSPDGKLLVTAGSGEKKDSPPDIVVWDMSTLQIRSRLAGHESIVAAVAFSPDGKLLASGSWDRTIKIWDTTTWKEKASLKGSKDGGRVESVSFSADGKLLATGAGSFGTPGEVKVWQVATGAELHSFGDHFENVRSVAFSPDGKLLATGGQHKRLIITLA